MSQLKHKLLLALFVVVIPFCFFVAVLTYTLTLGYQHDTDPEAFKKTLESLGVIQVSHFQTPSIDLPLPKGDGQTVKVKVSHYWPPLGGTNCSDFQNGQCVARMASGEPWLKWVDSAIACAGEWPFGTRFVVQGKTWVCMDRGGGIVSLLHTIEGKLTKTYWIDQLTETETVPYGTILDAQVYLPDGAKPTTLVPPVDVNISTSGYLAVARQNIFQKMAFGYLRITGLVSDDLLAVELNADPQQPWAKPLAYVTADCKDPTTPCLFPIEGGLQSVIVGTSQNGGLECHTGPGGPLTIKGWDFWKPDRSEGAILYSAMDGFVDWSGFDGATPKKNSVIQISNGRFLLTYMHMKQRFVLSGDKVTQGQPIGILGNVGNSDWAHLHFSVYEKNVGPICDQIARFFTVVSP